MHETQITMY